MGAFEVALARSFEHFEKGNFVEANEGLSPFALSHEGDARLAVLKGQIALAEGRAEEAIKHLSIAFAAAPDNIALRTKLAFAFLGCGAVAEAKRVATNSDAVSLRRVVAFADQQLGNATAAIVGFRDVLRQSPGDFESWNNLGRMLIEAGGLDEAFTAFDNAVQLRPDIPEHHVNRSLVLASMERHAERVDLLREAIRSNPDTVTIIIQLGLAEGAVGEFAAAEAAYLRALNLQIDCPSALLEYGMLLEKLNRLDDLDTLVRAARGRGMTGDEVNFLEASLLNRQRRFANALTLVERIGSAINPGRLALLEGQIADGLSQSARAFAAFERMNKISAAEPMSKLARSRGFLSEVASTAAWLTPERVANWRSNPTRLPLPSPIFIVGFPRSGTTLLDTFLRNLPELNVLEEPPMLERIEAHIADQDNLVDMMSEELVALQTLYFAEAKDLGVTNIERIIVDKFPLHMVRGALIHRLFPDARIIFVERHPCDVLLSCFMARFQTNRAMVCFQSLADGARLYDAAFNAWSRAEKLLPLNVHRIRYESLVAEPDKVLRGLMDFLDLDFRLEILNNQKAAAARGHIATASYAQVSQPIYSHSVGRWHRYERELAAVMPIIAPWVKKMDYSL